MENFRLKSQRAVPVSSFFNKKSSPSKPPVVASSSPAPASSVSKKIESKKVESKKAEAKKAEAKKLPPNQRTLFDMFKKKAPIESQAAATSLSDDVEIVEPAAASSATSFVPLIEPPIPDPQPSAPQSSAAPVEAPRKVPSLTTSILLFSDVDILFARDLTMIKAIRSLLDNSIGLPLVSLSSDVTADINDFAATSYYPPYQTPLLTSLNTLTPSSALSPDPAAALVYLGACAGVQLGFNFVQAQWHVLVQQFIQWSLDSTASTAQCANRLIATPNVATCLQQLSLRPECPWSDVCRDTEPQAVTGSQSIALNLHSIPTHHLLSIARLCITADHSATTALQQSSEETMSDSSTSIPSPIVTPFTIAADLSGSALQVFDSAIATAWQRFGIELLALPSASLDSLHQLWDRLALAKSLLSKHPEFADFIDLTAFDTPVLADTPSTLSGTDAPSIDSESGRKRKRQLVDDDDDEPIELEPITLQQSTDELADESQPVSAVSDLLEQEPKRSRKKRLKRTPSLNAQFNRSRRKFHKLLTEMLDDLVQPTLQLCFSGLDSLHHLDSESERIKFPVDDSCQAASELLDTLSMCDTLSQLHAPTDTVCPPIAAPISSSPSHAYQLPFRIAECPKRRYFGSGCEITQIPAGVHGSRCSDDRLATMCSAFDSYLPGDCTYDPCSAEFDAVLLCEDDDATKPQEEEVVSITSFFSSPQSVQNPTATALASWNDVQLAGLLSSGVRACVQSGMESEWSAWPAAPLPQHGQSPYTLWDSMGYLYFPSVCGWSSDWHQVSPQLVSALVESALRLSKHTEKFLATSNASWWSALPLCNVDHPFVFLELFCLTNLTLNYLPEPFVSRH